MLHERRASSAAIAAASWLLVLAVALWTGTAQASRLIVDSAGRLCRLFYQVEVSGADLDRLLAGARGYPQK